jgi:hypothetical protein
MRFIAEASLILTLAVVLGGFVLGLLAGPLDPED